MCVLCVVAKALNNVMCFLLVVVVVHVWEATRGKTCRVESLRVGLGAKAREWRMDITCKAHFRDFMYYK